MIGGIRFRLAHPPVDQPSDVEYIHDRHYVVLLVRVLVDSQNQLLSGEVGGPDEYGGPERWVRFHDPGGLAPAVERWVAGRP
jgi:hypothetical protein